MMRRTFSTMAWAGIGMAALIGCRNDSTFHGGMGADLSMPGGGGDDLTMSGGGTDDGGGGGNPDMGGSGACAGYNATTIAAMRQGVHHACAHLDGVINIGLTPSSKSPRLYVQDAAGGPFSAMGTKCSSTSTAHPCTVVGSVASAIAGHSFTIDGQYIKSSSGFEEFYISAITDNGPGSAPAATSLQVTDIERGAKTTASWFQKVTVNVSDTLVMYDWTPSEFVYTGATKCPYQFGFGMIPTSAGGTATAACSNSTSQPAGQTNPSSNEVLIGTDFYKGLTVSSDCRCNAMFSDKAPTASSTISGTISGILIGDSVFGTTNTYQYLAPQADADFPITNTQ
jgi:hypothetical protein